jgi:predicted P-loop ATPase
MSFYAESKLDEGKDAEILMTQKLIIMDDEFGGKSKQDAKKLKELSSKQWFNVRRPYGRTSEDLRRLAVLCGTSNDEEVINDPTGNRRIIPVNLVNIDHDKMKLINKTDLFIELYNEWREMGDDWMLNKEEIEMLNLSTQYNEQPSVEEEMILRYFNPSESLGGNSIALSNTEIKAYVEEKHPTIRVNTYKLGLILKKLGYDKKKMRVNGSNPKLVYLLEQIM